MMSQLVRWLARRRVAIGFIAAAAALILAQPSARSLLTGACIAVAGEAIRVWAAGHLEKSREVTSSGPYRFTRHPLYVGSTVMGIGLAVASRSLTVAVLVGIYLLVTLTAAIRSEESFLRQQFGSSYDAYANGTLPTVTRRFSVRRAVRNREYRAVTGLAGVFGLLALKVLW